MGVQGPGESVDKILRRPIPSHPLAIPPAAGTFGVWQIRRVKESPIGYILSRSENGVTVYHCYAHGRDDAGGRPWLRTTSSLNSAVGWMIQQGIALAARTARLAVKPQQWPC